MLTRGTFGTQIRVPKVKNRPSRSGSTLTVLTYHENIDNHSWLFNCYGVPGKKGLPYIVPKYHSTHEPLWQLLWTRLDSKLWSQSSNILRKTSHYYLATESEVLWLGVSCCCSLGILLEFSPNAALKLGVWNQVY